MSLRISDSAKIGPYRVRLSAPLSGKGSARLSAGTRTPFGWLSLSTLLGGKRRRRR